MTFSPLITKLVPHPIYVAYGDCQDEGGQQPHGRIARTGQESRCVSTILRQPAWEFSEFFPRLMVEKAG